MVIPIVDIFAGPGGLGEGFSAFINEENEHPFRIALSIEKDPLAHQTLRLRSFFRQFPHSEVPEDYYKFVRGNISIDELYRRWPEQAEHSAAEAWCGTLGDPDEQDMNAISDSEVDERIRTVLNGERNWVLIGGPPCQAYSIAGRSRRQEKILNEQTDKRVGLYKQYLRILAVHSPAIFVMENVKGILSAETSENQVFTKILNDLSDPASSYLSESENDTATIQYPSYRIYSLVNPPDRIDLYGNPEYKHKKFIIKAENHGVPQTRHRVILLGIRSDIDIPPGVIPPRPEIPVADVLTGLPSLRSGLSKSKDDFTSWVAALNDILSNGSLDGADAAVINHIRSNFKEIAEPASGTGGDFLPFKETAVNYQEKWYLDNRIGGVLNHASRTHMQSDLHRYLFASTFGKVKGISPKLCDFPVKLLPAHGNVKQGVEEQKFADRFRVQLAEKASKTITSHISKDGHYYIHPDPAQCRSLTVREAARLQTFPDNYFFCGPKTSQFHQVGNAVPPLLAWQIAGIVNKVFERALAHIHEDLRV
ncbi:DNA cytosine methyltransferase [Pontibacter beigongshangensis]|uniref:DNA cytosine methyltransferase n=1 Tax=Pontibacter beigongshangensis TaxID=2574733 RepID=UPI00164F5407|nr:DNA cytosine methyltransferase [Pontibacter beigongshangensis]